MITNISDFKVDYEDRRGRIGLMGIRKNIAEYYHFSHFNMFDSEKCLEVGTKLFESIFKVIRMIYPCLPLEEWYLLSLACYYEDDIEKLRRLMTTHNVNSWRQYKERIGCGVRFAEKVWKEFLGMNGAVR